MTHNAPETRGTDLATLLRDIDRLRAIADDWEPTQRNTLAALEHAVDALHGEALRRLLRRLKGEPGAAECLRELAGDEVIYAVLRHHGLLKASLNERIEQALADVRPSLRSHGGDVELVEVVPPDTVALRLTGACDGCPASAVTLSQGVEEAIREACPEIRHIRTQNRPTGATPVEVISPFDPGNWQPAVELAAIPDGGILCTEVAGRDLLLARHGETVRCFDNACSHMGLPLDRGAVKDGVLTCPHHGFGYYLDDGSCVSAPGVALISHPVRIDNHRVTVRLN